MTFTLGDKVLRGELPRWFEIKIYLLQHSNTYCLNPSDRMSKNPWEIQGCKESGVFLPGVKQLPG